MKHHHVHYSVLDISFQLLFVAIICGILGFAFSSDAADVPAMKANSSLKIDVAKDQASSSNPETQNGTSAPIGSNDTATKAVRDPQDKKTHTGTGAHGSASGSGQ